MGLFSKGKSQSSEKELVKKISIYKSPGFFKKVSLGLAHMGLGKFRSAFIQNLAMMLGAGLQVTKALDTLEKEAQKKPMRKLIEKIHQDVENGTALWRSMNNQAFFTPYTIALVRIGEESGSLAENLENLAKQDEKDHFTNRINIRCFTSKQYSSL